MYQRVKNRLVVNVVTHCWHEGYASRQGVDVDAAGGLRLAQLLDVGTLKTDILVLGVVIT